MVNTKTRSPTALIDPAKTHKDVLVYAVAARDKQKAKTYAKKYNIPVVKNSYQGKRLRNDDR